MNVLVPVAAASTLLAIAGYVIVLIAAQVAGLARARRLHEAERDLLRARIAQLDDPIQSLGTHAGALAWSGYRKFLVAGKVLEADDVCSLYLAPHDGQALPPYQPGQYLTFQLTPPGADRPVIRCYSLSDSPTHPDYYRVTIKRIRAEPGVESSHDGFISTFFHHVAATDELLDVKAPAGHFHLDLERQLPVVLAGAGIGITPLLSMVNYVAQSGSKREIWLLYGVRHGGQHAMKEHLRSLAAEHENIRLHVCYSAPRDTDVKGTDYDHAERISVELLRRLLPSNNYEFYTCGPAAMMDQMTRELAEWGVPQSHIHYEAFGAATLQRVSKDVAAASVEPVQVAFARSGKSALWDGSAASLLDFAEANGIAMESGCRAGNCGSCITAIRSGAVRYVGEPGAAVEEGSCLTCLSVPRGDLVLDA